MSQLLKDGAYSIWLLSLGLSRWYAAATSWHASFIFPLCLKMVFHGKHLFHCCKIVNTTTIEVAFPLWTQTFLCSPEQIDSLGFQMKGSLVALRLVPCYWHPSQLVITANVGVMQQALLGCYTACNWFSIPRTQPVAGLYSVLELQKSSLLGWSFSSAYEGPPGGQ